MVNGRTIGSSLDHIGDGTMGTDQTLILDTEDLLAQKIEARKRLLELNPEEAQQRVNQVLYPQYWKMVDKPGWEDSLEVDSAEPNP
jgi:hypothetical protein